MVHLIVGNCSSLCNYFRGKKILKLYEISSDREVTVMNLNNIMEYELFGKFRVEVVVVFGVIILLTLFLVIFVMRIFKKEGIKK
jgi:pantothenate kinase type III